MSIEENRKLVLEHYESFVQRRDEEALRKQLSHDFVDHEMPPGTPPGPEGAIRLRAMLHNAFPDLKIKIEDIVAEGDRVAVRARWTGTHRVRSRCCRSHRQIAALPSREWCSGASAEAKLRNVGRFSTVPD